MTKKHKRYVEFAITIARKSRTDQKQRIGCVIVQNGVPIGIGFNDMKKTHPKAQQYNYPFLHAELSAMLGIDAKKLNGAIAYVGRIRKKTRTGMAKPCSCCQEELRKLGVEQVFFTTDTEEIGNIKL